MKRIFIEKCFLFTMGSVCHNWVEKFSQGRLKVTDDAQPDSPLETATEATVQRVEELIQADMRITRATVATAPG
jgi:hypothetical protein